MALHCPATLLVAPTPRDARGVEELAAALAGERVLAVVRAPDDPVGQLLAEVLDVPLEDEPGLAVAGSTAVFGEIADLHRGETVVVLAPHEMAGETPFDRRELD